MTDNSEWGPWLRTHRGLLRLHSNGRTVQSFGPRGYRRFPLDDLLPSLQMRLTELAERSEDDPPPAAA